MSFAIVIAAFVAGLGVAVAKGIVGKEIQGRIERRISRSVEATIASLPEALQAECAEEWRAEVAAAMAMPLTAAVFARGLRRSAEQLVGRAGSVPTPAVAPSLALRPRDRFRRYWLLPVRTAARLALPILVAMAVAVIVGDVAGVRVVVLIAVPLGWVVFAGQYLLDRAILSRLMGSRRLRR